MFAFPAVSVGDFLPSLRQGLPDPPPGYEQIFLGIAAYYIQAQP
jgi:hypothetical protein